MLEIILPVCIGLAQIAIMYWQVKIMQATTAANIPSTEIAGTRKLSYWPVVSMGILAAVSWIPFLLHWGESKPVQVIQAWGNDATGCYVVLDGVALQKFSSKYYAAMACGLANPTVDQLQDTNIAMSSGFTIGKSSIAIEANLTQHMIDTVKALASLNPPQTTSIWRQSFLIPRSVDLSRIKRMSDVRDFGGKLISPGCDPIE